MLSFLTSPFVLTVICTTIAIWSYFTVKFTISWWGLREFPGPLPLPIAGNLYDPAASVFMKYLTSARKIYGKYFVFWRGNCPLIIVSDSNAVRQILSDTKSFVKGSDYTEKFSVAFGRGLVTSIHEKHRQDRSMLSKYFIRGSIEKRLGLINTFTKEMIDSTIEPSVGNSLNLENFFHVLSLQIFGAHAISINYLKDDKEMTYWVNDAVSWGSYTIGKFILSGLPVSLWNFFPGVKKIHSHVNVLHKHFAKIVEERVQKMASGEANDIDDCLTGMINAQIPRQEMYEHLVTLVSAGHDTTAYFGCYMAYLLAQNPNAQAKLKEEIKQVMGDRTEVTAEDINEMKYLKKVMQETLRLYTIIPFVTRELTQDITFEDSKVKIKKGNTVLVPLFLLNRDAEVFENPSEFIPERFDGIEGIGSAKHGYLPFGYGPRTCIGNQLAFIEASVMFSQLLMKYTIEEDKKFRPQIVAGISLTSKNGINVIFRKDSEIQNAQN